MSGGNALAVGLAVLAGIAGSVQVAVMGSFGERIGTLEALAFATAVQLALTLSALLVVRHSVSGFAAGFREPAWLWVGGLMGAFIVFTITLVAPKLGVAAAIGLIIAGQLIMGAAIDRFGLFGLERIGLTWPRVVGIALLAAGAALSLRK
ncbi:MAG: DMT family transporter [Actinobacteria bacterium]|nr:DMT family transporter [Actinomycetota bacterium]